MTITCKGKTFKVHSAIIASRSHFFAAACWGGFTVRITFQSQGAGLTNWSSRRRRATASTYQKMTPTAVWTMLRFLYGLDYAIEPRNDSVHDLVHDFGDPDDNKLDIPHPSNSPAMRICTAWETSTASTASRASHREKFAASLRQREWHAEWTCSDVSIGVLGAAIKCIYGSAPESDKGLRDQVLQYAKLHLKRLLTLEDFKEVLAEVPELAYQLLVQEAENRQSEDPAAKKRKVAMNMYELLGM